MAAEYKVLKKFGDLKKGSVFTPEGETEDEIKEAVEDGYLEPIEKTEGATAEDTKPTSDSKKTVTKVTFVIRNADTRNHTSERVFDKENHGVDFVEVANEFGATNANIILSRKDE